MSDRQPSRRRALSWALGLPAVTLGSLVAVIDPPPLPSGEVAAPAGRAAIAVRDPVHPVETLGTWMFVLPRLEANYEQVRAFTQRTRGDGLYGMYSHEHREAFREALVDLCARHERVDLFLLGHTNDYVSWIEGLDLGGLDNIGLVYNSGCWCGRQAERWTDLGAQAYVAHPEAAAHAPFFVHFLRLWSRGLNLERAVTEANDRADGVHRLLALPPISSTSFEKWSRSHAQIVGARDLTLGSGRE